MRRLIVGCLVFGGCVKDNPAWEDSGAEAGVSATSPGSDETSTTSGPAPTTSAGDEAGTATDSQGGSTTGAVTTTTTTTGTDELTSSTGEGSSTGAPVEMCTESTLVQVELTSEFLEDAGVVPGSMPMPCPWNGSELDCGLLNFGKTGFFRLVNDGQAGTSAALIRFDGAKVQEFIAAGGYAPKDLLGARLELVVYEPLQAPAQDSTLEIRMQVGDDSWWKAGDKDAKKAMEESSSLCRTREKMMCLPWPGGDALGSSEAIGELLVTAAAVAAVADDGDPGTYHARLRSELLDPKLVTAYAKGEAPSLVVALSSSRGVGEGVIGIKLEESEWDDPTLYLEVCKVWSR